MPNLNIKRNLLRNYLVRSGSRTAATSKMEHFVIMFNGFEPLTIITKSSILNIAAILDPPVESTGFSSGGLEVRCGFLVFL